jgi:hypothetical protein
LRHYSLCFNRRSLKGLGYSDLLGLHSRLGMHGRCRGLGEVGSAHDVLNFLAFFALGCARWRCRIAAVATLTASTTFTAIAVT